MNKELLFVSLLLSVLCVFVHAGDLKCRALVLEGGGSKGSYEIGALKGLIDNLPPEEVAYDVVSGVSAGGLNTALIAKYPKGSESQMVADALELWSRMNASNVYTNWQGGPAIGLLFRYGIFDTTPLYNLCSDFYGDAAPQRKISIASVDANTAEYVRYTEAQFFNRSAEDFFTTIVTSASMPMVFPHIQYDGKVLVDGGSMINLDVGGAVARCREIVDNDEDIIIDVILTGGNSWISIDVSNANTLDMVSRYRELNSYRKSLTDLLHELEDYKTVNFRYIITPSETLPGKLVPLDFAKEDLAFMINTGIKDAEAIVKNNKVGADREFFRQKRRELTNSIRKVSLNKVNLAL